MKFVTPWKVYDESEMECHDPGDAGGLLVYVSKDRTCVWTESRDEGGWRRLRMADVDQITELWRQYRITALLSVVRLADSVRIGAGYFGSSAMDHGAKQNQRRNPSAFM